MGRYGAAQFNPSIRAGFRAAISERESRSLAAVDTWHASNLTALKALWRVGSPTRLVRQRSSRGQALALIELQAQLIHAKRRPDTDIQLDAPELTFAQEAICHRTPCMRDRCTSVQVLHASPERRQCCSEAIKQAQGRYPRFVPKDGLAPTNVGPAVSPIERANNIGFSLSSRINDGSNCQATIR